MLALPRLRHLAPATALVAVSLSLFVTVPRLVAPALGEVAAPFDATVAEASICQFRSGRSWDACVEETEGKALIRDAERELDRAPRGGIR